MTPLEAYSTDYHAARERFRASATSRGWSLTSHPLTVPGFGAEDLTIDVARIGTNTAERLIVLSSGLHGAEGPFGSAAQLAWLDSLPSLWEPPQGCSVLLIHALNPFGYYHGRRWNEENFDLNRNFLAAEEFAKLREPSAQSLYRKLDGFLNPNTPPSRFDFFKIGAVAYILRYGREAIKAVLPTGQYAFPQGLFYGGDHPSQTTQIVAKCASDWIGSATDILHLDFHTGLGDWGEYRLLLDALPGSELDRLARQHFGDLVETPEGPTAYVIHGGFENALVARFPERHYLFFTAEFGTYSNLHILKMLRQENRAWHWGDRSSAEYRRIREAVSETFVPKSPGWRWPAIHKSCKLIDSAINLWAIR